MADLTRNEMVIRYSAIGLAFGIIILTLIYMVAFQVSGEAFNFLLIKTFHVDFWFFYLLDALPLLGLIIAFSLGQARYRHLDQLNQGIEREKEKNAEIRSFTKTLIGGELKSGFTFKNLDPALSDSLNKLKESLVRNREMERKRRLDERQRNWISEGLAEFGDILRTHSRDREEMAYSVISSMVRYLEANQGAIYVVEGKNDEKKLRMLACHAYDRKKFPGESVPWGDGLIGAVALEKQGYYTDKIPEGYLRITSGLGKANPRHLLIEPLVWNDQVYGIIELASFKAIEEYRIQFVSRVAESIATTLQTMSSALQTEQFLKETRAQAEQLAKQEEQGRQNMAVLKHTQEEAAKQAEQFISFTDTVNHTLMRAEYNTDGTLSYANTRFLKKMGYSGMREVDGKHISVFINEKDRPWFDELWTRLAEGGRHFEGYMKHETKLGQDLWTMATYTCVRTDDGEVEKVLFLAIDSTEQKKQSLDYEGQIDAIDKLNAKAVFSPDGRLLIHNSLFAKSMKYEKEEMEKMNVFDFFSPSDQERINEIWEGVVRGEAFQGQLKLNSRFEEEIWFHSALLSVNDMYGEVEKVIFLATEISREKEMEIAAMKQHEALVRKEEEVRLTSLDLKKKLEEQKVLRKQAKTHFEQNIHKYQQILNELPYPVLSINNLGFVLFINRAAEKLWDKKAGAVLEKPVTELMQDQPESDVLSAFRDPSKSNKPGVHPSQKLAISDRKTIIRDVLIVRSDLEEEVQYTLTFI